MFTVREMGNLGVVLNMLKKNLIGLVSAACSHQNVHCQCLCGHILSGSNHIQLLVLWLLCLRKNVFADASLDDEAFFQTAVRTRENMTHRSV